MDTIRVLLSKFRTFFRFSKKTREAFTLLLSCKPVSVTEYASVSLNLPKYPSKYLHNTLWLCQGFEYAGSSSMFDRILKMPPVLNSLLFWIWKGCLCKRYTEFRICLIMAPYTSIMPEYASIRLNVH